MKNKGIYKLVNVINGDIYIGQSTNLKRRIYRHFNELKHNNHCNKHLQNAFNKYGKDNFKFIIVVLCEIEELTRYEQELINKLKPLYNIKNECSLGGALGSKHTKEEKIKISESQKGDKGFWYGKHQSEESNKKRSEKLKNRIFSDEHRKKLSEANIGNKHMLGKHRTEETKRKISETKLKNKLKKQEGL